MIRLSDVTVRRGPNRIVEGVSLVIRPGAIFWVVGPNGAGKSSLLRVMVGLDRPWEGTVRREPGQGRTLFFQSEMALPAAATVGGWDRLVTRLGGSAERTALWPAAGGGHRVGRLSTGERKRLLLDALLRQPGPMVLDEPFEHLSPDGRAVLATLLESRSRDRVVVVATNQSTDRAEREGGIRIDGGVATPLAGRGRAP